ncbi:MAG: hypothetical protein HY706_04220 [Candidatus Hydrogenedentes bacterium]|nr:hypothetical protein [Candidatus Hydrogenedentota bacterium]
MDSKTRALAALNHQPPDRIPRFDNFWEEFRQNCLYELRLPPDTDLGRYFEIDIGILAADETPFPTQAQTLGQSGEYTTARDGWGRVVRTRPGAYFSEELEFPMQSAADLDARPFDSPTLESRYLVFDSTRLAQDPRCLFCKVGGPFLRSAFMRGKAQFLADIVSDPGFAKALADKVADHLIAVGIESLRRSNLLDTGIWIYDDIAFNRQPFMSPESFEAVFVPAYRRMVRAFKSAGAAFVCFHSDGDINPLLDMLIDVGIASINPVEPRAGMDLPRLKAKYGSKLAFIGGMCNARILPQGSRDEIANQARAIIEVAQDGGVIIGAHSIGPDVPVANYVYYHDFVASLSC